MNLEYRRGHEMSGYVTLAVQTDGQAQASRSGYGNLGSRSATGVLTPDQQHRLVAAIDEAGLLHREGSSRLIGDDEVPLVIAVGEGAERRELSLWADDAARDASVVAFEATVSDLVDELLAQAAGQSEPSTDTGSAQ